MIKCQKQLPIHQSVRDPHHLFFFDAVEQPEPLKTSRNARLLLTQIHQMERCLKKLLAKKAGNLQATDLDQQIRHIITLLQTLNRRVYSNLQLYKFAISFSIYITLPCRQGSVPKISAFSQSFNKNRVTTTTKSQEREYRFYISLPELQLIQSRRPTFSNLSLFGSTWRYSISRYKVSNLEEFYVSLSPSTDTPYSFPYLKDLFELKRQCLVEKISEQIDLMLSSRITSKHHAIPFDRT